MFLLKKAYLSMSSALNALIEVKPFREFDRWEKTGEREIPSILLISLADLQKKNMYSAWQKKTITWEKSPVSSPNIWSTTQQNIYNVQKRVFIIGRMLL